MAFQTVALNFLSNTYGVGIKNDSAMESNARTAGAASPFITERKLSYWIRGYDNLNDARAGLEYYLHLTHDVAGVPTIDGLPWAEITVDSTPSPMVYTADVTFRNLSEEEKLENSGINDSGYVLPTVKGWQISFATSSENEHIHQSEETIWQWNNPDDSRSFDFNRLIDFNNGSIGGYDRIVSGLDLTINYPMPKTYFPTNVNAYLGLIGKVNNAQFWVFPAGNVLFQSFNATPTFFERRNGSTALNDWYWDVQFNFNVKPTETMELDDSQVINGEWTEQTATYTKAGQDYVWTTYAFNLNGDEKIYYDLQKNCERVYKRGDFSGLGLTFEV